MSALMAISLVLGIIMLLGGTADSMLHPTSDKSIPLRDVALIAVGGLLIGVWAVELLLSSLIELPGTVINESVGGVENHLSD
ncbi:hypothetical protein [Corynebacterium propinquum]|uniref:hypothetical protein n=1 Tax=Corynebacterium propinquum TaxID=43769 RepID=UPI00254BC88E|nr:hypothetical protein [Corynebacterium propinquum]MDK8665481.1 hypothetical protein [Corynebacterium propinquum]